MHIETHGPEMHEDDSRYPMMGFIEQDYRKGKVINTKKKVRGMWRHKDWLLCGTGWTACSLIMSLSSDNMTCDFSHDDDSKNPVWYKHKVVSWNSYSNMGDAHRRMHKITDITWGKCTHFRKQAVEDAQLKGCVPDEVTQQTGHVKSDFFNAYCTDTN